jgi:SNF2 family DNA or RNA helicase
VPGSKRKHPTEAILSKEHRKALADAAKKFDLQSRKSGTEYLINGQVLKLQSSAEKVTGTVKGSKLHKASWRLNKQAWQNECSCPSGRDCKHAYAVAHYILQHGLEEAVEESEEAQDISGDQLDRLLNLVSSKPANGNGNHGNATQKSAVSRILEARNPWDALPYLSALLTQLGIKAEVQEKDWLSIFKHEDVERRAWLLTRELLRHGSRLPTELDPYRHCEKFEEEEQKAREEALIESIADWIHSFPLQLAKPERSIRIVWSWPDGAPTGSGPCIDLLISGKKLKDASRSIEQIRHFAAEVARDEYLFNHFDSHFLRWLDAQFSLLVEGAAEATSTSHLANTDHALQEWLTTWGRTDRCLWEDGTSVRFDDRPIRIVPKLGMHDSGEKEGTGGSTKLGKPPVLSLVIEFWNGETAALEEARMVFPKIPQEKSRPMFVFVRGVFYRVSKAPPFEVLTRFLAEKELPLDLKKHGKLVPELLRVFPRLATEAHSLVRYHPVKISFSFSLNQQDWLQVRLRAASKIDKLRWEFTGLGWVKEYSSTSKNADTAGDVEAIEDKSEAEADSSSPGEVKQEENTAAAGSHAKSHAKMLEDFPEVEATQIAQQWLEQLEPETGDEASAEDRTGWWIYLDSHQIEYFLSHWSKRPAGMDYYGNPAFRNLLLKSRRTLPKIRIRSSGMDWFSVSADWSSLANQLTNSDLNQLKSSGEKFIKLSSGQWISKEEGQHIQSVLDAMSDLGLDANSGENQKLTVWQIAGAGRETLEKIQELFDLSGDDETLKQLALLKTQLEQFTGLPPIEMPRRVQATMRNYQVEGLKFLAYLSSLNMGAILADDMGLGKTLQALSWMEYLHDTEGPAPCLVVCPASVVYNWQREAQKFVTGCKVLLLTSGENRHGLRKDIPQHDLVITNYALLRRDLEELKNFEFRAIILDEAQNIKNPDSRVAQAAKELRSIHKLALTGTPLENRLLDLWSIVDFVTPGYLGTRNRFAELYDVPDQPHRRRALTSRIRPILLRRIKKEVAPDLPDRIEERHDCELSEDQRRLYLNELKQARELVTQCASEDEVFAKKKIHILAALTRLRQLCCHPALVEGTDENVGSAKTSAFIELVEPLIAGGHKVLVFSQFVKMLNILEKELTERGIPYHMLTGQTSKREGVVEAFQNDPNAAVFLLSLRAAGTGLNLTAASYVILYDPWWNPAVEAQAIDRTHRIGQDRTVITYRLVTKDTVEDKILQLQQSKSVMVKDVIGEESFGRNLTREDLAFLFSD